MPEITAVKESSVIFDEAIKADTLKVNEIFYSIQGEGSYTGYPCVFIRLTACNLRCSWCDTTYSFYEGSRINISQILSEIEKFPADIVELTGGEPLLQKNIYPLIDSLVSLNKKVLIETSGSIHTGDIRPEVHIVLDMKAPGSGEDKKNLYENLTLLKNSDDLKIVIKDKTDFIWAQNLIHKYNIRNRISKPVWLQPVFGELDPAILSEWIKETPGYYRLGVQLHKILYNPEQRGV